MTLLEILVRDWPEWIGGSRAYQDADGDIISSEGYSFRYVVGNADVASDRSIAVVTEPRWREAKTAQSARAQAAKEGGAA